jgi:hypothetical protein
LGGLQCVDCSPPVLIGSGFKSTSIVRNSPSKADSSCRIEFGNETRKSWLLRDVEASHCDNLGLPEQRSMPGVFGGQRGDYHRVEERPERATFAKSKADLRERAGDDSKSPAAPV